MLSKLAATPPQTLRRRATTVSIIGLMIVLAGSARFFDAEVDTAITFASENEPSESQQPAAATDGKQAPSLRAGVGDTDADLYGDPLPAGALARLGTVRYRHSGWYKRLAFLPDNETVVVGTKDNTARLWHVPTGKMVREFQLEGTRFQAFAVSADGSELAMLFSHLDREKREYTMHLRVRDVKSARERAKATWIEPLADSSRQLAFAPDGTVVATGTRGGKLRLWDLATGTELLNYSVIKGEISSIDFSPDGNLIAVAGRQGIALWDWLSEKEPQLLGGLQRGGQVVKFSPAGKLLAVGSSDRAAARLWNVEAGGWVRELKGAAERYYREGFDFSADGKQLIVPARSKKAIEFFDVQTGTLTRTLDAGGIEPRGVVVSEDGRFLATIGSRAAIKVWDLNSGERISDRFVGHDIDPYELAFSPDGKRVFSAASDGTIREWESATGRQRLLLKHDRWVSGMAISPDGELVASCGLDDTLRLWDRKTGRQIFQVVGHGTTGGNQLTEVTFTADGQRFLSFGQDLFLRVWDVATGKALREHSIRPSTLSLAENEDGTVSLVGGDSFGGPGMGLSTALGHARFSPRDQLLLSVQGAIHVFDTESGQEVEIFKLAERIDDFCLSHDARLLATATRRPAADSEQRTSLLTLHEFASKKVVREIELPGSYSYSTTFSPDARFIATSLYGESPVAKAQHWISIWDTETGQEHARIEHFDKNSNLMTFSPDGQRLAVSYKDTTVMNWSIEQFRLEAAGRK